MTDDELEERLLRLEALAMIQSADTSSLLEVVARAHSEAAGKDSPQARAAAYAAANDVFLNLRKRFLHKQLEAIETKDPAKAARLQELIDKSCDSFPFDY